MDALLNYGMPRIRRLRGWLVLLMLLLGGLGWYLTWPTAPLTTWQEDDGIRYLTMCGFHTIVVGKPGAATLYPELTNEGSQTLRYRGA